MKDIKIGLFGVGYFGNFHLNNLLKTRFNVIGVYDSDIQRSNLISEKFGLKKFTDPEELIIESDAIDITTPTTHHFSLLKKAIELGKHIFVEKPMTFDSNEADEIKKMIENSNSILQVGHIERYNPVIENLVISRSDIINIEVNRYSTYNPRGTDVSVVFDLMIHDIDLVLHLMGNSITNIEACGYRRYGTALEFASASLQFDNGARVTLNASIIHPYLERKMKIWTTDKYYELDLGKKHTDIYTYKLNLDNNVNIIAGKETREYVTNNSIFDELNEFYENILNNSLPRVSVIDGFNAINLAESILDKIKSDS